MSIKKLVTGLTLAATLACPGVSLAEGTPATFGHLRNDAGGKIVFTFAPCPGRDNAGVVYAHARTGTTITGCWVVLGDDIVVTYEGGPDLRVYPIADVTISDEMLRYVSRRGRSY